MPVQKGKRRKRPRRRGRGERNGVLEAAEAPPAEPSRGLGLGRGRRRREMPPLLNIGVGVFLLIIGILFSLSSPKGFPGWEFAVILLGYLGLSGYYLSKGYRQYRARRQS